LEAEVQVGKKMQKMAKGVDSTDGSSDYGGYKTAVSSKKKEGGDEAHSKTDNFERNQTKQDSLVKGWPKCKPNPNRARKFGERSKESRHCQENSRNHGEASCKFPETS
jgi:hypothetical protein